MYKHILLATDGSPCAMRAAQATSMLAECNGARVTLVYVQPTFAAPFGIIEATVAQELIESQEQNVRNEFNEVIKRTRQAFDSPKIELDAIQARGYPGDAIISVSCQTESDLIVIGHRGLNVLQTLLLGSTSERVVHAAKCSVLVVR